MKQYSEKKTNETVYWAEKPDDKDTKVIRVVKEQELPDPDFSTVKSPNPEEKEGFKYAIEMAKENDVDFIIGGSIQGTFPTIVKALAAQGNTAPVITTYVNVDASIASQVWSDIEGKFDVLGNGWVDLTTEEAQASLGLMNEWIADDYDNNVYAMTGWIAGQFFTEGLTRLEGEEVTWDSYMTALESEAIKNPFGGVIDYSGGQRMGTQEMNLSRISSAETWEQVEDLKSIKDILGE